MASQKPQNRPQGSLLVVEDDRELAHVLSDVLSMSGYDVVLKATAGDAMEYLNERGSVVAAILDVEVPDGDSFCVADRLRSADIPYVFASGSCSPLPREHHWAPYFSKPYPIAEVIDAIEMCRSSGVPKP